MPGVSTTRARTPIEVRARKAQAGFPEQCIGGEHLPGNPFARGGPEGFLSYIYPIFHFAQDLPRNNFEKSF